MFRINNNDFKILSKYKEFLLELDNVLENVPRKDMFYKDKIKEVGIELLNEIIESSYSDDKLSYFASIKTKISVIDFELERFYNKKYISLKAVNSLGLKLVEINKMLKGFLKNECKVKWFN